MHRQPSILRSANTMIGAAALESIRPVRQPKFDSFMFDPPRPVQEAAPDPAAGRSEAETQAGPDAATLLGGFAPPEMASNRPPQQSGGIPAATDTPDPGNETRVYKSAAPASGTEQISPEAEAPRPGVAPVRYWSDAPKPPADPDLVSDAAAKEPERILPPDSPSRSASHRNVMFPVQANAIVAQLVKAAPDIVSPSAGSKQMAAAAVSAPPVIEAAPPRPTGKAPNQKASSLEALSTLLNTAQSKPAVQDLSARPRDMPARDPTMRASAPQVHIGTLEIRIEGPAPAKAPPVRSPLPPSGPGIVSRLRLRSL